MPITLASLLSRLADAVVSPPGVDVVVAKRRRCHDASARRRCSHRRRIRRRKRRRRTHRRLRQRLHSHVRHGTTQMQALPQRA